MGIVARLDDSGLKRKINLAQKELGPRRLLKAIGLRQLSWIDQNFRQKGKLVGGWQPIKPATRKRKKSSGILVDSGRLKQSFSKEGPKVRGVTSVWIGTNVIYAGTHEEGYPEGGIPQRRMLPNKREAKQLAVTVIEAAVARIKKRRGF